MIHLQVKRSAGKTLWPLSLALTRHNDRSSDPDCHATLMETCHARGTFLWREEPVSSFHGRAGGGNGSQRDLCLAWCLEATRDWMNSSSQSLLGQSLTPFQCSARTRAPSPSTATDTEANWAQAPAVHSGTKIVPTRSLTRVHTRTHTRTHTERRHLLRGSAWSLAKCFQGV